MDMLMENTLGSCLLLDEMQLESDVKFQRNSLQFRGFVDLGANTFSKDMTKREAIILLENSGYFVDFITTDGTTWNRTDLDNNYSKSSYTS
ncbi:Transposable element P transposase [Aphis craccivora]|uniref:Transposable element P transposase n=1 Tax=Aphis craccivora TaxID=307492 RepID=A0A6G0VQB1_APHCR|nr:Transposable element P transposase [Aphis craccivora]